ncbi:MAG: hypothetical protein JXP34_26815, partial [Planctomycetes bacterium]|nr:hypothetical protein [Planctomycetota bacterium]
MDGFLNRLRRIRSKAGEESERVEAERAAKRARAREVRDLVESTADDVERHIERRLAEFREEFVEFLYDSFTWEGRQFRVYFNEPTDGPGPRGRKPAKRLH